MFDEDEVPVVFEETPDESTTTEEPQAFVVGDKNSTPGLDALTNMVATLAKQNELLSQRIEQLAKPTSAPTANTPTLPSWVSELDENDPYAPAFVRQAQHVSGLEQRLAQLMDQNQKLSNMVQNSMADQAIKVLDEKFEQALRAVGTAPEFTSHHKQQLYALHANSNGRLDIQGAAKAIKAAEEKALTEYTKRLVTEAKKPKPINLPKGVSVDSTGMPEPKTAEEFDKMRKFFDDYFSSN